MKLYLVNAESDYFLSSFYSMTKRETNKMLKHIDRRGQDNFILDSGAFSLFSGAQNIDYKFIKKYIDRYCDFVNYYKIKNFIEMDIDKVIGYDEVKKINKYIISKVGRDPLYVHHTTRTYDDFINACKSNDYIFFGGLVKEKKSKEFINSIISEAYSIGTKVHLLGFTPPHLDTIKHLYSCDSSSWSMGGRSGLVFMFKNNKIVSFKMEGKKRVGSYELNKHNLEQWLKYQQYLKTKGWITE